MSEIRARIQQLVESRRRSLARLPVSRVARQLGQVAALWLDPGYDLRAQAVLAMTEATGFSPEMIGWGLDAAFRELLPPSLEELAARELDGLGWPGSNVGPSDLSMPRRLPEFITHFCGGAIITPGLWSLCFGLTVKAANLVKCSSHDPVFLPLFIESLRKEAPELGHCAAAMSWNRQDTGWTAAALEPAEILLAFGRDESLRAIQDRAPAGVRFIGHGHKVSLAVLGSEAFSPETANALARDVAFYDQQGCLSPHVVYLIADRPSSLGFCQLLAEGMAQTEARFPRGSLAPEEAAQIQQLRAEAEIREAQGLEVQVWQSRESTAWTLLYDEQPKFEFSCLNRVLRAKRLDRAEMLQIALEPVEGKVQGMAIAPAALRSEVSEAIQFARANHICDPGSLQCPPLHWHDDGVPPLASLVLPSPE